MFYEDFFVSKFFSLDSILFALFDILTLFQGRLVNVRSSLLRLESDSGLNWDLKKGWFKFAVLAYFLCFPKEDDSSSENEKLYPCLF
ncbi:hypothetical protein LEP1GSC131_0492 [Leptospira kirschneri str. 200802841]|uniref:Uncharacterized protein n=1 Tax=Leptospira kirschneri str. 200802841 TaxID=1193047 RepID=A0A828Y7U7_9LEPT|nr:hypothetical protein LEP1GSC131_0492 [Leptospira kirschneri str. 200802841]